MYTIVLEIVVVFLTFTDVNWISECTVVFPTIKLSEFYEKGNKLCYKSQQTTETLRKTTCYAW